MSRKMHLLVNFNPGVGMHPARWRVGDPRSFFGLDQHVKIGQIAERGKLDGLFLSDIPGLISEPPEEPWHVLEPTIALAAIAARTTRVGLVSTLSTTFNEPYNLARQLASLDHLSHGRAGWNIVATAWSASARNFGLDRIPGHDARYDRAEEFVEVVLALWDSWEPEAFVGDAATGQFVDPDRIHAINHAGEHFAVRGPLQVPTTPQGRPVLVQAGTSPQGKALGSRYADIVFVVQSLLDPAQTLYADIKARVAAVGRDPEAVKVLPAVYPIVGSTEADAFQRRAALDQYLDMDFEVSKVADKLGLNLKTKQLDVPLDRLLEDRTKPGEAPQGLLDNAWKFAQANRGLTLREFILRAGFAARQLIGAPEQIADDLERWFSTRAGDGFNLSFSHFPDQLELFVDHVVPELQRRGLFRADYEGETFRQNLGIEIPANRHAIERVATGVE